MQNERRFGSRENLRVEQKVDFGIFLGGKDTDADLLDCLEQAGIELRPEIDKYFADFKKR